MKTITEKTALFSTAIGKQKYLEDAEYRFFTFVVKHEYKDKILLFNTLSREIVALTKDEINGITDNIRDEFFKQLVNSYFLVPKEYNDIKLKNQFVSLIPLFENKQGITNYIIYSTMECNARCFYCYERGAYKYPMSDETANDVADYIIKNSLGQKVSIQWFGGEPLYNQNPINIITDKLRKANIEFKSKMVSNGYLFDDTTVDVAKNKWNLKSVQITLDGTEDVYNRCKAYIYKTDESPFCRVLDNIESLLQSGIFVSIRMNMDNHNKDDLYTLINILKKRFTENRGLLFAYTFLLLDNFNLTNSVRLVKDKRKLTEEQINIEKCIAEYGLGIKTLPNNKLSITNCMADNSHSTTILPDGKLGKCEHYTDSDFWGSIYSDNRDVEVINKWKIKCEPIELCKTCPILPQCNRLKHCPDNVECDEFVQKHRLSKVYYQMQNAYDKYLKENCESNG